jgi:hypothetical protein
VVLYQTFALEEKMDAFTIAMFFAVFFWGATVGIAIMTRISGRKKLGNIGLAISLGIPALLGVIWLGDVALGWIFSYFQLTTIWRASIVVVLAGISLLIITGSTTAWWFFFKKNPHRPSRSLNRPQEPQFMNSVDRGRL